MHDRLPTCASYPAAPPALTEFMADMGHDLRTPIAAILGFADLLSDPRRPPETRADYVRTIRRNAEQLRGVLDELLDLSRIESGRMTVERARCLPARVVAEVESLVRDRAAGCGTVLTVEHGGGATAAITTDPVWLRQGLLRLVGGVVGLAGPGVVRLLVGVGADARQPARRLARFDVTAPGIDMTAGQLAALFSPPSRAGGPRARGRTGMGPGLAVARRVAEALGGGLTVDSTAGEGALFSFVIDAGEDAR